MKIDTELSHTIVATARANAKLPNDSRKNEQEAVDKFLATAKGKKIQKAAMDLQSKIAALDKQRSILVGKRQSILAPAGLDMGERRIRGTRESERYLKLGYGDDEKELFLKSGGILPNPERRNWSADELLRKLAAAKDVKTFNALLAEYGINWI